MGEEEGEGRREEKKIESMQIDMTTLANAFLSMGKLNITTNKDLSNLNKNTVTSAQEIRRVEEEGEKRGREKASDFNKTKKRRREKEREEREKGRAGSTQHGAIPTVAHPPHAS